MSTDAFDRRDANAPAAASGDSPFHEGEVALQRRTGVRAQVETAGRRMIRDHMPPQHRELFARLPTLLAGCLDAKRRPWASMLFGQPGFVHAPDDRHLVIATAPLPGDPLHDRLVAGTPVGLLGLEPQTRRRNRANGTIVEVTPNGFTVQIEQSFGNCPQYIQARSPHWVAAAAKDRKVEAGGALLSEPARALIERADTFFIASASAQARGHAGADGVDVSHRGGRPGFVHVTEHAGRSVLTAPDFRGNSFFNTLGNVAAYPRAGLLFVDYASGDLLQVTGTAEIFWDGAELRSFSGALRLLRLTVEASYWFEAAAPLRWSAPEPAPQLAVTGRWNDLPAR